MATHSSYYAVYKLRFSVALEDPDITSLRYHAVIFLETSADNSRIMYHVIGDIASGMSHQSKPFQNPEMSRTFHSKGLLRWTHPIVWDNLLQAVPVPKKQKSFNIKSMKTEPFKTLNTLTFYKPGERRRPLVKCTEWTEQRAIPAHLSFNGF
ncbi:uncharacterized protein F4822DRAFT_429958 [Hypoxylon trugodes]|uniref:uncharacterized protein n=1 Tax=Hypoxylon trugodes TaxID=326681 RepID=UPI0021A1A758|nr:uncharacterized protein F4822DRAFT_429958 [Hypoxylon trugodes]KAI1387202.1 hypothetical protein F4822DRAFT_429958 [Hypoxylon trugodes]